MQRVAGRRPRLRGSVAAAATLCVGLLVGGCGGGDTSTSGTGGTKAGPATTVAFAARTVEVGGKKVSVACSGSGPRTVVFVGDVGQDGAQAWGRSAVPDGVAADATVCIYDRPGLGASDTTDQPRTIENHVKELAELLPAAGIKTPVVLVAQGYGTIIARQFGKDHRNEVAGLVLVDPPLWSLDLAKPEGASPGVAAEYEGLADLNANLGLYGAGALPPPPAPTVVIGIDGEKSPLPGSVAGGAPFSPTTTSQALPPPDKRRDLQKQLAGKSPFGRFEYLQSAGSYAQYWDAAAVAAQVRKVLADGAAKAGR